jgi:hypothetical protein
MPTCWKTYDKPFDPKTEFRITFTYHENDGKCESEWQGEDSYPDDFIPPDNYINSAAATAKFCGISAKEALKSIIGREPTTDDIREVNHKMH